MGYVLTYHLVRSHELITAAQHTFAVIRSAGSSEYNYVNPVMRDTVNTGLMGDNVTIRFMTDNPGPWLLHW
jgi:iron transport multicopper oxidase